MPAETPPFPLVAAAVFGLLWGSFLNVCIFRVVRDLSVVAPRSFCPRCEKPIAWYDNIPVLSFLILQGRCRQCGERIGVRYPLVEIAAAALLAGTVFRYGWTLQAAKWGVLESLALVLFCTDLELRILPDEFTLAGLAAGLAFAPFEPVGGTLLDLLLADMPWRWRSLAEAVVGSVLLSIPLWGLAIAYARARRLEGDALGLGDVKLVAMLGAFFGFEGAIPVLVLGTACGAAVGLAQVAAKGKVAWGRQLPFGSFLCAGAALFPLLPWRRF